MEIFLGLIALALFVWLTGSGGTPPVPPHQGPAMCAAPEMWQRLMEWRDRADGKDFVRLLEKELNLKPANAPRLADEYLRFLALAVATDEAAAPPKIIDQAWRLHRRDEWGYEVFCRRVLVGHPHHTFDRPPPDRDPAYEQIRARYAEMFGVPPPPDLWPDASAYRKQRRMDWFFALFLVSFMAGIFGMTAEFYSVGGSLLLFALLLLPVLFFLSRGAPVARGEGGD